MVRRGGERNRGALSAARMAAGAAILGATVLTGCGNDGLQLAAVEGIVLVDGQPVADVGVVFSPVDSKIGPPAVGTTDSSGRFSLVTANRVGAVVGEHRVAVSKDDSIAIPQPRGFPIYKTKSHIAPKFGSVETSGLTATVVDDDNEFQFSVASK